MPISVICGIDEFEDEEQLSQAPALRGLGITVRAELKQSSLLTFLCNFFGIALLFA